MKLADDDLMTWIFNGQRIACTVEKACEMLGADHLDWSDELSRSSKSFSHGSQLGTKTSSR